MTDNQPLPEDTFLASRQDLLRLRRGDTAAFELLYETYYDRLWRFAYSFVRTRAVAQEIVQDVFLSLWTGRESLDIQSSLSGYLYTAVRNHALKFVRHEQVVERELEAALNLHESHGAGEQGEGAQEHLEREEISAVIEKAVEGLSERHRTAILLRWKHGMRYEEIARILGISPQAARTLVLRVQAILKEIIVQAL